MIKHIYFIYIGDFLKTRFCICLDRKKQWYHSLGGPALYDMIWYDMMVVVMLLFVQQMICSKKHTSWWLNHPSEKIVVKLDHFTKSRSSTTQHISLEWLQKLDKGEYLQMPKCREWCYWKSILVGCELLLRPRNDVCGKLGQDCSEFHSCRWFIWLKLPLTSPDIRLFAFLYINGDYYCWWKKILHQLSLVVYPITYKVLYIPDGELSIDSMTTWWSQDLPWNASTKSPLAKAKIGTWPGLRWVSCKHPRYMDRYLKLWRNRNQCVYTYM